MEVRTKDSGKRDEFSTGARRDTQNTKPRFDLISVKTLDLLQQMAGGGSSVFKDVDYTGEPVVGELPIMLPDPVMPGYVVRHPDYRPDLIPYIVINRLAHLYGRGEKKYGANNWQKGINLARTYASLLRHAIQWFIGDRSEDHLAAVIWNATSLMWTETEIAEGRLPKELADAGPLKEWTKDV